jgi:hypothetical protein
MSLIFATQLAAAAAALSAVATAGLLIGAIVTAKYAIKAFRTQSDQLVDQRKVNEQQTKVLELQARELRKSLEEREREAARRVRAQAALVFLTEDRFAGRKAGPLDSKPPSITVTVVNSSNQPIYEVDVYWQGTPDPHGEPTPEHLGTIMPGQSARSIHKYPPDADLDECGAELTFRDSDGIVFVRRPDGYLSDLVVPVRAGSLNAIYRKEGILRLPAR